MNILSELNTSFPFDAVNQPSPFSHFWILDAKMEDFRLAELEYLEEVTGPTVKLRLENQEMTLPASWHVIVIDRENSNIDSVPITMVGAMDYELLFFSPHDSNISGTKPIFLDVEVGSHVYPMMPKGSAFVMPIASRRHHSGKDLVYSIILGPYDLGRWIEGKTAGDILC